MYAINWSCWLETNPFSFNILNQAFHISFVPNILLHTLELLHKCWISGCGVSFLCIFAYVWSLATSLAIFDGEGEHVFSGSINTLFLGDFLFIWDFWEEWWEKFLELNCNKARGQYFLAWQQSMMIQNVHYKYSCARLEVFFFSFHSMDPHW